MDTPKNRSSRSLPLLVWFTRQILSVSRVPSSGRVPHAYKSAGSVQLERTDSYIRASLQRCREREGEAKTASAAGSAQPLKRVCVAAYGGTPEGMPRYESIASNGTTTNLSHKSAPYIDNSPFDRQTTAFAGKRFWRAPVGGISRH